MNQLMKIGLSTLLVMPMIASAVDKHDAASYKDGFTHLISDPKVLNSTEFEEVDFLPESVALYYDGDRLHRKVPKIVTDVVESQLTMKLVKTKAMKVAECADCNKTKIVVLKDAIRVETPADTAEEFKELGKKVGADGFMMWDATEADGRFNLAMRMVNTETGHIVWSREYNKDISKEDVELGYSEVTWRSSVSTWGLTSTRNATAGGTEAVLSGVTAIGIERKMIPFDNSGVGYSIGLKYFQNTSNTDTFSVTGGVLNARVVMDMDRMFGRIPYSLYAGLGNVQYNSSRGFMLDAGIEIPFANHGYMGFGVVQLSGDKIDWDEKPGFESYSEFGGVGYDFTIGFNF